MKRQMFLVIIGIFSLLLLHACSDESGSNNPWQTPVTLKSTANINDSIASSNNNGDLVIVWQEQETQKREDTDLNKAHDPNVPYDVTDLISPNREIPAKSGISYDSSNDQHRADAKREDYGDHETHTHLNVYQRVNLFARVYDADAGVWLAEKSLDVGFWDKMQTGEQTVDDAGVSLFRVSSNVGQALSTYTAVATGANGDAMAAWIQLNESTTLSDDAGKGYSIKVARFSATDMSWKDAENVIVRGDRNLTLSDLSLTIADGGKAQLLWLARDTSNKNLTRVYASTFDRKIWSSEVELSANNGSVSQSGQVRMYSADAGIAVWVQQNSAALAVYQGNDVDPCIATPSLCDSTQSNLYGKWFDATGWQGSAMLISNALGVVGGFTLATNSNGHAWLIWEQNAEILTAASDSNNRPIFPKTVSEINQTWVSQFDTTAHTWDTAVRLQADDTATTNRDENTEHAIQADLAIDDQGNAMAVWIQQVVFGSADAENTIWNNSIRQTLWSNTFTNNAWAGAALLNIDERFSNENPQVIATSSNNFTTAWLRWSSLTQAYGHQLFSVDYDLSSNTFEPVFNANTRENQIMDFYLAKNKANDIQVVWTGDVTALRVNVK